MGAARKCCLGTGLLTRLRLQESSHPLTNQLCYYHEGRGRHPPSSPTRKQQAQPGLSLPTTAKFLAPKALQLFSPIFLPPTLYQPRNCPKQAGLTGRWSLQSLHLHHNIFPFQKAEGVPVSEFIALYMTRTCTERTGCCCTSTKPQMHHKWKATRQSQSIFHLTKDNC